MPQRLFAATRPPKTGGFGPVLAAFVLLAAALAGAPGHAQAARLMYKLVVLGVPVAEDTVTIDLTPAGYGVAMAFRITGVASLFSGDRMESQARGLFDQEHVVPLDYRAAGRFRGQDRSTNLVWRLGEPQVIALNPIDTDRLPVPASSRAGTIDPLSALTALIRDVARTGRCDDSVRTFDGRKLEQFDVRTAGEEAVPPSIHSAFSGPGLRCAYVRRVLAGARGDGTGEDGRTRAGSIWLGPVLPGLPRLPMRVVAETQWLGDATIYLTGAAP